MYNTPGHWVLASLGKKVLRPGGKKATLKLLEKMNIQKTDNVTEIAPGMGYTAGKVIPMLPKQYTGIDLSSRVVDLLNKIYEEVDNVEFKLANATDIPLKDETQDKVYGEAMLTMQDKETKKKIIGEALRILKQGGTYSVHEVGLLDVEQTKIKEIKDGMANAVQLPTQPMKVKEWLSLFEEVGFKEINIEVMEFNLLKFSSLITDEKFRVFKIMWNFLTKPKLRKRALSMKKTFDKNRKNLRAVVITAKK